MGNQKISWNKQKWKYNIWAEAKEVIWGKFIGYVKEKRKISNKQALYNKELVKQEQTQPKVSRREEIKIRSKINEIETREDRKYQQSQELIFEKVNKTDKPSARLTKKKRTRTQNCKWKRKHCNWYHRSTKDRKRLQWSIHQQIGQPREKLEKFLETYTQSTKSESWRNRKSKQTNNK